MSDIKFGAVAEVVNVHYQNMFDTASYGNFNTRRPEDAIRLTENIATIKAFEKMNVKRGNEVEPTDESQLAVIKETVDSLHSFLKTNSKHSR